MDELLSKVVNTISSAMRLTYTAIFILERYSNKFVVKKQSNSSEFKLLDIQLDNPLLKYILRYKKILVCDEIDYVIEGELSKEVKNGFNELKAQVVIPIILKDKVIGLLVLGYKKSGDIFNQQDLDLLEMISSQISIILENTNLYEQIQNTSKLALIGSMAAGMAHEIRNPLSSIKMFVQMLPEKYFDKDFIQKFNEVVLEEINRLSKLVDDMLTLSKPKPPNLKLVEMNSIIIRARRLVEKQAEEKGIKIVEKYNKIPQIKADESQLIQVFVNVFLNGIQSMSKGGILSIESNSNTNGGLSKYVTVAISDTGDGISKDDLDRIFEPFFTTRKEGTGLGLSICLKIIEEHNGFIKVVSKKNKGTTFTIFLPK
jgi:signal transduction histidine kinase